MKNKIEDALLEFYLDADKEVIKEKLLEDVDNMDAYEKSKKRLLFKLRMQSEKVKNDKLKKLVDKFYEGINNNVEKPISLFKELLKQEPNALPLYKNLDKLTKEDIIDIIKDKNLVKLIEVLEKND